MKPSDKDSIVNKQDSGDDMQVALTFARCAGLHTSLVSKRAAEVLRDLMCAAADEYDGQAL